MKFFCTAFVILFALTLSTNVSGHSEHDKSRFVSPSGVDNSRCDNVLRPCKTIAYAVSQANKGDSVLLAAGTYDISNDDVFYLKSALVPVLGGYNRFDHYQSQSPQSNVTTLLNVPLSMANDVRNKGFRVIADGKSIEKNKALQSKLASYQKLSESQAAVPCENGKAGEFDCENIDLLYHLPLNEMSSSPASGSDIWGHVDLNNGREYALMALHNGLIIVDVTTPESPTEVATINGVDSGWRDVKVYQHFDKTLNLWQSYAYLSSEGSRTGAVDRLTIIDLNSLPNSANVVEKSDVVSTAHNVYISNVDYSLNIPLAGKTASLQIVGANNLNGAFQSYPLDNPTNLSEGIKRYFGEGYTHDGASLSIDDERANSDCGITEGDCTLFIDFNEKEMKLWDITDPSDSKKLGTATYDDVALSQQYVHSGWGTDDKRYVLLHDEFDESRGGLNTTVRIFSIDNLKNPTQVGQWTGPTQAIDHNGFVRGNRYYMSNYERGLTVLDITDPSNPEHVGFFDTYPPTNSSSFNGAWGVYPFLPSGNILVSDINSGLYILKDRSRSNLQGELAFSASKIETINNDKVRVAFTRSNVGESTLPVSVDYSILPGSAEFGSDFNGSNGTINWGENDTEVKVIWIDIVNNDDTELSEQFFIRLSNPSNGAVLGDNNYLNIVILGAEDNGAASFTQNSIIAAENFPSIRLTVNRLGVSTGELAFQYTVTSNSAEQDIDFEVSSTEIMWKDGEADPKYIDITIINDSTLEDDETFSVELQPLNNARIGSHGVITVTIADDESNQAPVITLSENFESNTGQRVELTAQASDPEADTMTYIWQQSAGSNVIIDKENELTAYFTAPSSAETLEFTFTATDFRGGTSSQTVTVSVVAPTEVITVTPKESSGGGSTTWLSLLVLIALAKTRLIISRNKE